MATKNEYDFSDMNPQEIVELVLSTAIVASKTLPGISIVAPEQGLAILIEGWTIANEQAVPIAPLTADEDITA